jgi:hypothetical protein
MKKQISSRMRRFEERRLRTRLIFVIIGSTTLVLLLAVFGVRLLIGFSVMVDTIRGNESTTQTERSTLVIPPYIDSLPIATSSSTLVITGRGQEQANIIMFINDQESKKTRVAEDGTFIISSVSLPEGTYTIQAKAEDEHGKYSDFSNTVQTTIIKKPPEIEVTKPNNGDILNGEDNLVSVEGRTDDDVDVRVNDRFVVVKPDGSFQYPYPLQEGENELTIKAIDLAGNTTQIIRKVTYNK